MTQCGGQTPPYSCEVRRLRRVPVARGEDRKASPLGRICPRRQDGHDRVAVGYRQGPTRAEVVLRIDQQQAVAWCERWRTRHITAPFTDGAAAQRGRRAGSAWTGRGRQVQNRRETACQ